MEYLLEYIRNTKKTTITSLYKAGPFQARERERERERANIIYDGKHINGKNINFKKHFIGHIFSLLSQDTSLVVLFAQP